MEISTEKYEYLVQRKKSFLRSVFKGSERNEELIHKCEVFYTEFLGLDTPKTFLTSGPREAYRKLLELMDSDPIDSFKPNTKRLIAEKVFAEAKASAEFLKSRLGRERYVECKRLVFGELNRAITHSVASPIFSILNALARETCQRELADYPSFADKDWLHFYSIICEAFELNNPVNEPFRDFVDSGLFAGFFYDKYAILIPSPEFIKRDEIGQLHEEEGAAIEWRDDTRLCYWNGIHIPEKLIFEPDLVTADDILKETNAEVRRCYQEALGSRRFGSLLGLITLDKKLDRYGNELILYRTKERDRLAGNYIYFAKVVCPSTGRIYFLCVPPGIESVEHAVSWTFGKTPEEYTPQIET